MDKKLLRIVAEYCMQRYRATMMNTARTRLRKGFTMVELMVVMVIMAVLMTMAGGVLRDAGKGRGVDSGVDLLETMVREARATAQGNDTCTRLVIVNEPQDTSANSRHLRFMAVQMLRKEQNVRGQYDGTDVGAEGRWVSVSAGVMLPPGVYFSPYYSRPLDWADGASGTMIGQESARLSGKGQSRVYYIEFDERGRFVAPMADPLNKTRPQRLVLINARPGTGRNSHDGIVPLELDAHDRPAGAKGIVVYPTGDIGLLRTIDHVAER